MNIFEMEIKVKLMETNMVDAYISNLHIGHNINVNIALVMNCNDFFFFWQYPYSFSRWVYQLGEISLQSSDKEIIVYITMDPKEHLDSHVGPSRGI